MWIDESSDPNRFMTVDEHWKYVGTITEDMLDYITLEAESATCVYDAAYDADDLSGLLGNLVKEHKLEEVCDRLKGMLASFVGKTKTRSKTSLMGWKPTFSMSRPNLTLSKTNSKN